MRSKINYQDLYREKRYRVFLPNDKMILSLPDKHKYIIGLIFYRRLFDRTLTDYVPLYSVLLKSILGRYQTVIKDLFENGILKIDNSYYLADKETGEKGKCKGYKLTYRYSKLKVTANYITDNDIIEKIEKHKDINIPKEKHYKFIYDNLLKIEIDYKPAIEFINAEYTKDYAKAKTKKEKEKAINKFNSAFMSIDYIYRKKWFFKVDDVAGRIHNNITNLSRDLRKFLRYNGQKLKNIDIANSQPFLFNILIQEIAKMLFGYDFKNGLYISLYKEGSNKHKSPYVTPNKELNCKNNDLNELNLYYSLTSQGILYDYLMEKWQINTEKIDRNEFKKIFFGQVFFINPHINHLYEYRNLFDLELNIISRIIDYCKNGSKKTLPIKLQKAEADIIINKIIKRITRDKPELFALTIHDSILTTEENVEYVKKIMFDEFENNFNLKPSIKIE